MPKAYWQDSLFMNSKLIDLDSSSIFIETRRKEVSNLVANSKDSIKKIKSGLNWEYAIFSFSDIIYLRHKSIFLNYGMWYDGHGGTEDLYFYQKEKGQVEEMDPGKRWRLVIFLQ